LFISISPAFSPQLQGAALVLNTIVLIVILIAAEMLYADSPKTKRRQLVLFYPFIVVCIGLVAFAAYHELGGY